MNVRVAFEERDPLRGLRSFYPEWDHLTRCLVSRSHFGGRLFAKWPKKLRMSATAAPEARRVPAPSHSVLRRGPPAVSAGFETANPASPSCPFERAWLFQPGPWKAGPNEVSSKEIRGSQAAPEKLVFGFNKNLAFCGQVFFGAHAGTVVPGARSKKSKSQNRSSCAPGLHVDPPPSPTPGPWRGKSKQTSDSALRSQTPRAMDRFSDMPPGFIIPRFKKLWRAPLVL